MSSCVATTTHATHPHAALGCSSSASPWTQVYTTGAATVPAGHASYPMGVLAARLSMPGVGCLPRWWCWAVEVRCHEKYLGPLLPCSGCGLLH